LDRREGDGNSRTIWTYLNEGEKVSNHYSAANLKFPGDDARLDLTDLYVFPSPQDRNKTVLIIDANPFWSGMSGVPPFLTTSGFHPNGVYRINIDNDGDLQADVAFSFVFSELVDGVQTGTAYYATGSDARQAEPSGDVLIQSTSVGFNGDAGPVQANDCRLFIGVRSDPFFADAEGSFHDFQWTGQDTFANKNVLSIAVEAPNERLLGAGCEIGVWATVSVRRQGRLVQVDRGGHPTINPFINPNEAKDEFNIRQPVDDVQNYHESWTAILTRGGYPPEEAAAAALTVLPDILRYDTNRAAAYPNGRLLTDDVFSARMSFLSHGRATSQGIGPHDDLQAEFPFLGAPNPLPA
jgi:hypothetical protein